MSCFPETREHIVDAINDGYSSVCTIDRAGAIESREESLKGIPTRKGYDRVEWHFRTNLMYLFRPSSTDANG
ncbi:hypothetical protein EDD57_1912 [Baia soyae]|uniref:Uncharacterized protein n=1 Tax=Baia soyae TaxID=1544746 RepID=A0A4R2R9I7_9BACL|nr:hypothetical protein EDD57_1912 [Baia soyae]